MMKKFFTRLTKSSTKTKLAVGISGLLVTLGLAGAIVFAGYGPNRPVLDWNNPADRTGFTTGPVFNSFINTPVYGDERAFVDGKNTTNTQPGGFQDQLPVDAGQTYTIRMYVHNNANPALNDAAHNYIGIARNTRVRFNIIPGQANGSGITGYINADNAAPTQVYDTVDLRNENTPFSIQYVPGSAMIENQAHPGGVQLSDEIVTNGVKIGYEQMDGSVPGCFEYSAYVTIKVKVVAPQLTLKKQIRMPGETAWHDQVNAKPGETVQWLVQVTNTGSTDQHNVVASDLLPPHLSYVDGSAKWYSASQNGVAYDFNQFIINNGNGGYIFGNYAANGGGFLVRFDTKVNGDFEPCSVVLTNVAHAKSTESPNELTDVANVNVTKENCQPTTPSYTCDVLNVSSLGNLSFRYTANATGTNGATIKSYVFNFGDGTTPLTTDKNVVDHTYAKAGTYATSVTVNFSVNGQDKTATSTSCAKTVVASTTTTTTTTTPTVLPNTGAGSVAGIFAVTSVAGAAIYRLFLGRRLSREG